MSDAFVTYVSPILYIGLSSLYTNYFIKRNSFFKPIAKILPHTLVVCSVMYIFATTVAPYPVISAHYLLKLSTLLHTYLFTMIADVIYYFPKLFFYGLIYSCIALWNMSFMLSEGGSMFEKMTTLEIASLGLIACVILGFACFVVPKMRVIIAIPSFVYCILLVAALWSASLHIQRKITLFILGTNSGVILLCIYSWLTAIDRLKQGGSFERERKIMVVYYAAMFLISYCTILAENEPTFRGNPEKRFFELD